MSADQLRLVTGARSSRWFWALVSLTGMATFVSAMFGIREVQYSNGPVSFHDWLDIAYQTTGLFGLLSPPAVAMDLDASSPWGLQIGRWLAPATMLSAILWLVFAWFRTQAALLWLRLRSPHLLIIGFGDTAKLLLSAQPRAPRDRIVVLVDSVGDAESRFAREHRLTLFVGDLENPRNIAILSATQPARLVLATDSDALNLAVADLVSRARRSGGAMRCDVNVANDALRRSIARTIAARGIDVTDLGKLSFREFCSALDIAALACVDGGRRVHCLVMGLTAQTLDLLPELMQAAVAAGISQVKLTLTHPDPGELRRALGLSMPGLMISAQIDCVRAPEDDPLAWLGLVKEQSRRLGRVSAVLVASDDEANNLATAISLHGCSSRMPHDDFPVYAFTRLHRLPQSLASNSSEVSRWRQVLGDFRCESLSVGHSGEAGVEALARQIHERYAAEAESGSVEAWPDLPSHVREANRQAAAYLRAKLQAIGLTPLSRAPVQPRLSDKLLPKLSTETVETLARNEHRRWSAERLGMGWQPGTPRSDVLRRHPLLVPWDELPKPIRQGNCTEALRSLKSLESGHASRVTWGPEIWVGVAGTLNAETGRVAAGVTALMQELEGIRSRLGPIAVVVCTPGAPGVDALAAEALLSQLQRQGFPNRLVLLECRPRAGLEADWLDRVADAQRYRALLARLEARARWIVPLHLCDAAQQLPETADNSAYYQLASAFLALRCDIVLVIPAANAQLSSGGSLELIHWREHRDAIPPELRNWGESRWQSGLIVQP